MGNQTTVIDATTGVRKGHTVHQQNRSVLRTASVPGPILPHGGHLVDLIANGKEAESLRNRASAAKTIWVDSSIQSDLELLAVGAYSPLTGFLGSEDFRSVLDRTRLADGTVWPIPIVLPVSAEIAGDLSIGELLALDSGDRILGVVEVEEVFEYDKTEYARKIYGTESLEHPGVARLFEVGPFHVAGRVHLLERPETSEFPDRHLDPRQTRLFFDDRGWKRVVGFQTRNPIHRAHEFIMKSALEVVDGLLVHPLVGETKAGDIPADVRMRCYESLLDSYYPSDRTLLSVFPATMRYAGPREAIFHALVRKNYGCTHFIVGRDHAGVGDYYGTYDAQETFRQFTRDEIGIEPLNFEHTFYCRPCEGMASVKTCPHDSGERIILSGTKVREMLGRGEIPPAEFTRTEVAKILVSHYSDPVEGQTR